MRLDGASTLISGWVGWEAGAPRVPGVRFSGSDAGAVIATSKRTRSDPPNALAEAIGAL
jgi:hypothetical protein